MYVGRADNSPIVRSPAKGPAAVQFGKAQRLDQQKLYKAEAVAFKPPGLTRRQRMQIEDPEFPPGFNPAVRVHSTHDFPGLATDSNKVHPPTRDPSNDTSAAGQHNFSYATAKGTQATSPPTLSKVPIQPPTAPPGFPDPPRNTPTAGLNVDREAHPTAPLPILTHNVGAESDSHKPTSNDITADVHRLSNSKAHSSSWTGSSSQQPEQRGWHDHSGQLQRSPQQSGWDVHSDSDPQEATTLDGGKQLSWDTHSQQNSEMSSISTGGWRPDQYQGTAANLTGSATSTIFHKPQQQRTHSVCQYSPESLAGGSVTDSRSQTEPQQEAPVRVGGWNLEKYQGRKTPTRAGGWNPDKYQGTATYNVVDASTKENQCQHCSNSQDDTFHSLLSFAFPQAANPHNTSEARSSSSSPHFLAEKSDPDAFNSFSRMHPKSSFASSRRQQEVGIEPERKRHSASPLPDKQSSHLQSQQSWEDSSSHSRRETASVFPGGFGLRPSHRARSSEGSCAQLPSHNSPSSASEQGSEYSSSSQYGNNGSAYEDDKQQQQHAHSMQPRQASDLPEETDAEGGHPQEVYPSWGSSEGSNAGDSSLEGADPEGAEPEGPEPEGAEPEGSESEVADPEGADPEGADPDGADSGYVTQASAANSSSQSTDLLQYWRQEPEELEWVTAGPKRDKKHENRSANGTGTDLQKPLALLEHYYTEGKIVRGQIDDRQELRKPTNCLYCLCHSLSSLVQPALLTFVCNAHEHHPIFKAASHSI